MKIGFLGAGRMATALAGGMIRSGFVTSIDIFAADVVPAAIEAFVSTTGGQACASNAEVAGQVEMLIVAVKPHQVAEALAECRSQLQHCPLIVSIAAGVTLSTLVNTVGEEHRVVRVMPNTPALVGAGAAAFALSENATAGDAKLVREMLETVGIAVEVPEHLLDAVTGLSGSGPAYAFQIVEALSDGGVKVGLPRDVATRLAAQTLLGAARMVLETGQHPGALKDAVTSPGGTTIAGLHAIEQGGLRGILIDAVEAATARSRELGSGGK